MHIFYVLEFYDLKLQNYTCFWSVLPNYWVSWGISKLQNYACFAYMYWKLRYSLYVIPHNWFNTYVYKKVDGTKLHLISMHILYVLEFYEIKLRNYACFSSAQPTFWMSWGIIQTTKLRLFGMYVWKLYIFFDIVKQLSLLCNYVYKKVKETKLQSYSWLALT